MALYVTVQEFKAKYKDVLGTADDPFIADAIQGAQDQIDAHLNRVVLADADTTEYFDSTGDEIDGRSLWLDMRGDLSSITTVTNGDGNTLTAVTEYETYPKTLGARRPTIDRIVILGSVGKQWESPTDGDVENAISIAGKWGMYNTVATVPEVFKLACMELTAYNIEKRKSQIFETTAIPEAGVITTPAGIPINVLEKLRPWIRY